jgi:hypothetical protein
MPGFDRYPGTRAGLISASITALQQFVALRRNIIVTAPQHIQTLCERIRYVNQNRRELK